MSIWLMIWVLGAIVTMFLTSWDLIFKSDGLDRREEWWFCVKCSLAWPIVLPMLVWYWIFGQDR